MTGSIEGSGDITSLLNSDTGGDINFTSSYCFYRMFKGCTSLVKAPELPSTTLSEGCYVEMFRGCTSLIQSPKLPAKTLVEGHSVKWQGSTLGCYSYMFDGCSSLNKIEAMFTTTPSDTYTKDWVKNVSANGTFIKNSEASWDVTGNNGIPNGWTVETASA